MKNTVLLLLLGAITPESADFNGMVQAASQQTNQQAEAKTGEGQKSALAEAGKIEGKSLSEALAGTDLDLSSFEKLLGKQKMKDGEDEDEEEEEDKDKEGDDSKKEESTDSDSKEKDEKKSEGDQRLNGRDKNGMYKNHKNYVNLRNKINEQESGHQKMFDSINDKLSDRNFIQAAIDTASTTDAKGPFDRKNNPFEQFRTHKVERMTSVTTSSHTITTTSSSSSSHSSTIRTSYSHGHGSSSALEDEREDAEPPKANPHPQSDPPDLLADDAGDAGLGHSHGAGGHGHGAGGHGPHGGHGPRQVAGHPRVSVGGGAHTGRKPSFDFGPMPSHPPAATEDGAAPAEEPEPNLMTKEEEKCYSDRYFDLNGTTPEMHYMQEGRDEGRYYQCGNFMTWRMGRRYLDRYWELGDEFGRSGGPSFELAKKHWHSNGTFQNPKLDMGPRYPEEEAYKCADQDEECQCNGVVHLGQRIRPDNGEEVETFQDLLSFARLHKKASGPHNTLTCSETEFNTKGFYAGNWGDLKDLPKQCWCEPDNKYEPYHCSADGGDCSCKNGNVFYGAKFAADNQTKIANFEQMTDQAFTVVAANQTEYVACDASSFEGVDPLPGQEKECYCDDRKNASADIVKNTIEYWRGVAAEKAAREAQAKADAEAEAAQAEEEQERARLEAKLKKTQEEKKKLQEALDKASQCEDEALKAKLKIMEEAAAQAKKDAEEEAKKDAEEEAKRKAEYEKALKEAADKAKAAEQEKSQKARRRLVQEAQRAKAAAIKAEVAAALARQKAEHDREVAERAARDEEARIAAEKAANEKRLQDEKDRLAAEAEEEEKRREQEAKKEAAHKAALLAQKEQAKAALEKALAEALEKQKAAFDAKLAEQEKERLRRQKEKEEEEARQLAKKMAAEAAAEEARKKAEEERLRAQAEAEAAEAAAKAAAKAEEEEQRRLEKEAHKKAMAEMKAKDELLKAQRLEELAKTEAEVQAAQDEARKAQEALDKAEKDRLRTLEAKAALEDEINASKAKAKVAKEKAEKAAADMEEAQKKAANWKKMAEEAKKKAAQDMADAEAAQKKRLAELEAERKAEREKHEATLKQQAESFKKAQIAAEKAHREAEQERKAQEALQIAAHKKAMAERRANFEKKFRNVWSTGATGVSMMQMTTSQNPDEIIAKLFKGTMIADDWNVVKNAKRTYAPNGHITYDSNIHHMTMITSDDRVAEAIEEIAAWSEPAEKEEKVPFDLVVVPLATGSKEYIEWVKQQSLKKDDATAFFNEEAMPAMKPLTETVEEKKEKASSKADDSSHVQIDSEKKKSMWSSDPEDEDEEEDEK